MENNYEKSDIVTIFILQISRELSGTGIAVVHCSSQTSPLQILQKLLQFCRTMSSNVGRVLRPKETERLVLFLKGINLVKPDSWGTSMLSSFLQQLITYQGFYEDNLEWVTLEGVHVVASMSAGNTLGRYELSSRLTSIMHVAYMEYSGREELHSVYSAYLYPLLQVQIPNHPVWVSPKSVQALASSMMSVYEQVRESFTSDMFPHYIFNPQYLTKWTLNLTRYDVVSGSNEHGTSTPLLLAWAYEACRLFRDKMAAPVHVEKFDSILAAVLRSDWGVDMSALEKKYYVTYGDTSGVTVASPHGKNLGLISSKDYKEIIGKGATVFSREVRSLKLHFFPEVLTNMAYVERVLTSPGGSLLLAGRSGVGRRTALSVISHMHRMNLISPRVSRNYTLKQLKLDLRTAVQQAGIDGDQVVLLLEDHQLLESTFLESINSLLCSGEIPGLFTSEELDTLTGPLKEQLESEQFNGTLGQYLIRRVMKNLHIVFILDSSNPNFRTQCEANPALYTKCEFLWLDSWAPNTMSRLPRMVIPELEKEKSKFHLIHNAVPDSTPRQYLASLDVYNKVVETKKRVIKKKQDHLTAGVNKLNEAKSLVDDLKAKAAVQSKVLAEKQKEADEALNEITARIQQASENKQEMEVLKSKLGEETVKLEQRKKAIDIELADIQPLVDEAKSAVGNIKSESLSEIRSLRAPPDVIRDILEGVLQLMGIFDTSWVSMRSFLAKRGVKEEIISFDARKIAPDIRNAVEALLEKNKKSFDPKTAKRASLAAAPLASWVRANVQFSIVLEKIGPLESEQKGLMKKVQKSQMRIENLEKALDVVETEVSEMRCRFDKRTTEASRLAIELDQATETITAAENLVGKLVGEHTRWSAQVGVFHREMTELPLYSQLAASFITYLGPSPEDVRVNHVQQWSKEVGVDGFDLARFLSTESEQLLWKAEGLPSDMLSVENALIILNGTRTPFLIDPSCRATQWLKEHHKNARYVLFLTVFAF